MMCEPKFKKKPFIPYKSKSASQNVCTYLEPLVWYFFLKKRQPDIPAPMRKKFLGVYYCILQCFLFKNILNNIKTIQEIKIIIFHTYNLIFYDIMQGVSFSVLKIFVVHTRQLLHGANIIEKILKVEFEYCCQFVNI